MFQCSLHVSDACRKLLSMSSSVSVLDAITYNYGLLLGDPLGKYAARCMRKWKQFYSNEGFSYVM